MKNGANEQPHRLKMRRKGVKLEVEQGKAYRCECSRASGDGKTTS
jgi:hypothetical protein